MPGDIDLKINAINQGLPFDLPKPANSIVTPSKDAKTIDQIFGSM